MKTTEIQLKYSTSRATVKELETFRSKFNCAIKFDRPVIFSLNTCSWHQPPETASSAWARFPLGSQSIFTECIGWKNYVTTARSNEKHNAAYIILSFPFLNSVYGEFGLVSTCHTLTLQYTCVLFLPTYNKQLVDVTSIRCQLVYTVRRCGRSCTRSSAERNARQTNWTGRGQTTEPAARPPARPLARLRIPLGNARCRHWRRADDPVPGQVDGTNTSVSAQSFIIVNLRRKYETHISVTGESLSKAHARNVPYVCTSSVWPPASFDLSLTSTSFCYRSF